MLPLVLLLAAWGGPAEDASLKQLYDGHRWFELREAIRGKKVSPLYAGAVASAFNETRKAERMLNRAAVQRSSVEEADEAHGTLAYLYARLGRNREAVRHFDAMMKLIPERPGVESTRALFAAFARYPDQSVGRRRHATLRCKVDDGGLTLPASINGKTVRWMLDTGFNLSGVSEAEARMLGLEVMEVNAQAGDLAGGRTAVRAAVAPVIDFGGVELHNVPLLVLPDSQPPMNELPPGERGLFGLPVAIAFRAFRWTKDGSFTIGLGESSRGTGTRLWFDGLAPVIRVGSAGKPLDFIFDTGNGAGTQLWERFANDFAAMVNERGMRSSKRVTQVGGAHEREVVMLPEVRLRIGGFEGVLRPANVFRRPVGNEYQHGLLGMDVLSQAKSVSVDSRTMTVGME